MSYNDYPSIQASAGTVKSKIEKKLGLDAVDGTLFLLVVIATFGDIFTTYMNLNNGFMEVNYHASLIMSYASFEVWALTRLIGAFVVLLFILVAHLYAKTTDYSAICVSLLRVVLIAAVIYSGVLALSNFTALESLNNLNAAQDYCVAIGGMPHCYNTISSSSRINSGCGADELPACAMSNNKYVNYDCKTSVEIIPCVNTAERSCGSPLSQTVILLTDMFPCLID